MDKTSVSDENQLFETLLLGLKVKATTKEAMLKLYHKFGFDAACFKQALSFKEIMRYLRYYIIRSHISFDEVC